MAGFRAQRAAGDDLRFVIGDGVLVERGLGQIPVDLLEIPEPKSIGAEGFIAYARLLHENLPKRAGHWPGRKSIPMWMSRPEGIIAPRPGARDLIEPHRLHAKYFAAVWFQPKLRCAASKMR